MVKKHMIPKIAFIDDGINPDFVSEGVHFDSYVVDGDEINRDKSVCGVTHGTRCYEIFRDNVQAPYHLVSIKVLNDTTGKGTNKAMLTALHWCAKHDIELINMSMGTRQFSDFPPVVEAIENLSNKLVVAACSNSNTLTFPACLPTVIGVRHCEHTHLQNNHIYIQNPYDQIDVFVCTKDINLSDCGENSQTIYYSKLSNSLATPLITARICDYISQEFVELDVIRQRLKADALDNCSFADYGLYKSLLHKWEDLSIPIVAMLNNDSSTINKLSALLDVFNRDGYRAIALTNTCSANVSNLIFQLEWRGEGCVSVTDLIMLYYNFALPDILFLHMDLHSLLSLAKELQLDIIIAQNGNDIADCSNWDEAQVLELHDTEEKLYMKIRELLS